MLKKQNLKIEDIFAPRSPFQFIGFAVVGVIINLLSGGNPLGFIGGFSRIYGDKLF